MVVEEFMNYLKGCEEFDFVVIYLNVGRCFRVKGLLRLRGRIYIVF